MLLNLRRTAAESPTKPTNRGSKHRYWPNASNNKINTLNSKQEIHLADSVDPQLQTMIDNMPEKTGKFLEAGSR